MGKLGGARPGAGRKPSADAELQRKIRLMIKEHGAEKVKILVKGKWVEKPRTLWVLEKLYMMAVGGNTVAAKEYMERQAGKSEQPIGDVKDDGTISITLDR